MNTSGGVQDTLRDMWATRPTRSRREAKLAGVAAAIGRRYDVDPVLIRVAFVVAVFAGGAGLALYLLAWLVLPPEQQQVSGSVRNALAVAGMVLLVLFGFPFALLWVDSTGVLAFLGALVAVYLLHRNHQERTAVAAGDSGEQGDLFADQDSAEESAAEGSAQPGWDLAAQPATAPKRNWITWTVLALAVLAAGGALALGVSERVVPAAALAVLGIGMIAGAFFGAGRALLAFALPVGAIALLIGTVHTIDEEYGADHAGRHHGGRHAAVDPNPPPQHVVPSTWDELDDVYSGGSNPISLDLQGLRPDPEDTESTSVSTGSGPIRAVLPPTADVTVRCSSTNGPIDCFGARTTGGEVEITDDGPDGPGGGSLRLELSTSNGPVEVRRG